MIHRCLGLSANFMGAVLSLAAQGCFAALPDAEDSEAGSESDSDAESDSATEGGSTESTDSGASDESDGSDGGSDSTGGGTGTNGEDGSSDSGDDSGSDSTDTDEGDKVVVFPASVVACGEGFLDEIDHAIGDPFARVEDDVRTGSCLPDVCAIQGESGMNGVDMAFQVDLPPLFPLRGASFRVRGIVNGGVAGTTEFYLPGTTTRIARCTIDTVDTEYGECIAVVEAQFVDMIGRDEATFYTYHGDPGCYFIYDFIELTILY